MRRRAGEGSKLITTTVRFDPDLWSRVCVTAELIGVGRATLVRDATREHLARIEHVDRVSLLEGQVAELLRSVGELMRTVAGLSRRLRELLGGRRR